MNFQCKQTLANIVAGFLFLSFSAFVEAAPKWQLFSKPEKPIQSLILLFVDPPTTEEVERQKNFSLSAMGMSSCAKWIGQRAAILMSQSGIDAAYGGSYNKKDVATVLNQTSDQNYRLLFTPVDVVTALDGMFGPKFAHINYRVRVISPDDSDLVHFETTINLGNSASTNFVDRVVWRLSQELEEAGLKSRSDTIRPKPIAISTYDCPVSVK